jgi:putative transposase
MRCLLVSIGWCGGCSERPGRERVDPFPPVTSSFCLAKYPQISRSWRAHRNNLNTLFNYPEDIRRAIYTTNAIESLNSVIRKVIKKRKLFPTDDSAKKVVYLAIRDASKKWTMPIRNWKLALNRFMIEFEDRLAEYI